MPAFPGFIGPAFQARAAAADSEALINLQIEQNGPNTADRKWVLYSTPGLSVLNTLPTSPIRCIWVGEGRLFVVAGSKFYELNNLGVPINGLGGNPDRGDVGNDNLPAQIFPNGNQVMIVSAGDVYIDTGTALIQPIYTSAQGYVNVEPGLAGYTGTCSVAADGSTVTRLSGDAYDAAMIGRTIAIVQSGFNWVKKVTSVPDASTLMLEEPIPSGAGPFNSVMAPAGALVSLVYGDIFDTSMETGHQVMLIDGDPYVVGYFLDDTHVRLLYTWDLTATDVAYSIANSGTVNTHDETVSGVTTHYVELVSGDPFVQALEGETISISPTETGVDYTVDTVINSKLLTLTTSAGTQTGSSYAASVPVSASCGAFLDGFFVVADVDTKQVNISKLYNGLRWDPLDVKFKEAYPDNIVMLFADHEELYLMGSQTSEVWRNTGNADFPFERDPGGMMHVNCGAKWSVANTPDGVVWLSGDHRGGPVCYVAKGYVPARVSTHALEYRWRNFSTWIDAEAFAYEEDGHWFYQITFPTANETWVLDLKADAWHQRASGAVRASLARHRARCHGYHLQKHIVGDYSNGKLYLLSSEYTDDAGTAIVRVRRAPHLSDDYNLFCHSYLALYYAGTYSTLTASWSDDFGTTWSTPRAPDGARIARGYSARVLGQRWSRLGSAQDRIYELVMVGTSKLAWLGAELEVS